MIEFLQANWFWLVLIVGVLAMHSFGAGCCGSRSRRTKTPGVKPEEAEGGSCH